MANNKKHSALDREIIHETDELSYEIIGANRHFSLHKSNKKTNLGVRVFVDGNTSLEKFKKDCKKFLPKKKKSESKE